MFMYIFITNIDICPYNDNLLKNMLTLEKYQQVKKNKQSACGQMLVSYALQIKYGYNNYKIKQNKNGKPYIDGFNNIFISISHSNKYAVVALDNKPCAIDIEKIHIVNDRVIKRVLSSKEYDWLYNYNEKEKIYDNFIKLWTMKESFIKINGDSIFSGLNNISLINNNRIIEEYMGKQFKIYTIDDYIITSYGINKQKDQFIFYPEGWSKIINKM